MVLADLLKRLPNEYSLKVKPRAYFNHSVEFKKIVTPEERVRILESVGLNIFFFPSECVTGCDLLSDSGTTTMTNEQWAALHKGDEAYGSNKGYFILLQQIKETFGEEFSNNGVKPNAFLFHQGRPSEDALFTLLGRLSNGLIIPSNGHFDTTQANMELNNIKPLNLFSPDLKDKNSKSDFKGNMDIERFKKLLKDYSNKIPLVYLTITNNTGGGQPVSMENIRTVSEISHLHDIPLFFDACRFAENAWFIKNSEQGYQNKSVKEIIKEMFSYVDGFTISFKKDGLSNIGGGIFLKSEGLFVKKYPKIPDSLTDYQILKEGHPTYGGMSGRDIMTISYGLRIVTREEYLNHRMEQVKKFGQSMNSKGIPILNPIGGHAVYLDINRFFAGTDMKPEDFGGIAFTAVLLAAYGHRACELGNFAFGSYDKATGREKLPEVNFVRFAIPRLRYEEQDLESVAEAVKIIYNLRNDIPRVEVTYGRDLPLRHFKAKFKFKGKYPDSLVN